MSSRLVHRATWAIAGSVVSAAWINRQQQQPCRLDARPTESLQGSLVASPVAKSDNVWHSSSESLPEQLLKFVDESPSPYHAVDNAKLILLSKGFKELLEQNEWEIQPGGKYFVNRTNTSGSSLTAFAVGKKWLPGDPFSIVATHVDSPCLRLKPHSRRSVSGYQHVGVELYGGGLWHTWFCKDLSIAGRVLVRTGPETIETRLVKIREPLLHIPALAVHYQKQNPFEFDTETKLLPLLASDMALSNDPIPDKDGPSDYELPGRSANYWPMPASSRSQPSLVDRVASELGVASGLIVDFDLCLFDVQKAALGGIRKEFVFASRLDNLMMTFCGLTAFTRSLEDPKALDNERAVRIISLFDHEEISSKSSLGALSPFLPHVLQRICKSTSSSPPSKAAFERSMSRSFLLSADQTHAFHPLYPQWHEVGHRPKLNGGLVISSTARNAFMRNTPGAVLLQEIACRADDLTETGVAPLLQSFTTPNNVSCGSTLGPLLGTQTGIRTLDVGNCQLSMHSTRETAGVWDIANAVALLQGFWRDFMEVDEGIHLK